jgi:hypothetical protein
MALTRNFTVLSRNFAISMSSPWREGVRAVPFNTGDDWTRLHLTAKTGKNYGEKKKVNSAA